MQQEKKNYGEMPQIQKCAIWRKTSKMGNEFLAGLVTIEGKEFKLVAFANKFKNDGQNRPDWKFDASKQ